MKADFTACLNLKPGQSIDLGPDFLIHFGPQLREAHADCPFRYQPNQPNPTSATVIPFPVPAALVSIDATKIAPVVSTTTHEVISCSNDTCPNLISDD